MNASEARLNLDASGPAMALPGARPERAYASRPATVLVHAGSSSDGEALVRQAAEVANLFGAKLIGVSTPPDPAPARMSAIEEDAIHLILENAALRFETASAAVRAGACWTASEGPPLAALGRLAWAADLIVVTRGSPAALRSLVVGGGRPILLTPATATRARFSRVLVRWDGSAACRRALAGALPFLARADRVDIAPDRRNRTLSGRRALHDLEEGLALRGVEVRTTTDGSGGRLPCDAHLLEQGADLVVTSAWPAPPNRPLFARSLEPHLQEIDSCVLLSH